MNQDEYSVPERKVGFSEGIDDEAVALAFAKLQKFPQFKLVRSIPLRAVFKNGLKENSRVLDFGCGTGHFLVDLSKKAKRKGIELSIYGLDITQTMLDRCQESFKRKNISGVHLLLGDGKKSPVENNFFNVISTSLSLHHWDNPEEVLTEIYRIIKPGGRFILFDLHRAASKRWFNFLKFLTRRIVPKALRNANEPLGSLLASYTEEEIMRFIEKTPWSTNKCEIAYFGPFIILTFQK
jgi:ubiquinone/menaquinone biosynthesis C-methylase UbiE